MNSIRRQLTVWISCGLILLWFLAGVAIYLSVRSGLIRDLDAQLSIDTKIVRSVARGVADDVLYTAPRAPRIQPTQTPDYHEEGSGYYYQTWKENGESNRRSASLGDRRLVFPGKDFKSTRFETVAWDGGTRLRVLHFRNFAETQPKGRKGRKGMKVEDLAIIAIARDLQVIDRMMSIILVGIIVIGIVAVLATVGLIRIALNRCLKPLYDLSDQTTTIDANSLGARFDDSNAPSELDSVYVRLNDLVERLQNSFQRERRFSSNLAHEIRTPIAELKMMSEFAMKWPEKAKGESHAEYHDIALQLEKMVESLFTLARWESGNVEVNRNEVDLSDLIAASWKSRAEASSVRSQKVDFDLLDNCHWHTDPELLAHIISNLLSNAVDYTPELGRISVTATEHEITVSNRPHGLTNDDLPRLFDRYWRQDQARSDGEHAGLGLSLAASCAEVLGMELDAAIDGEWLRFRLVNR